MLAIPQLSKISVVTVTSAKQLPGSTKSISVLQDATVGGSLSSTITKDSQVERLPLASVAVQISVVVPTGKSLPAGVRVKVTFSAPQLS